MSPAIQDAIAFERIRLNHLVRSSGGVLVVVLVFLVVSVVAMPGNRLGLFGIPIVGLLLGFIVCAAPVDGFEYQFTRFQNRRDILRGRWIAAGLVGAPFLASIGAGVLLFQRSHALVAILLWLCGYLLAPAMLRPPGTKGSPSFGWLLLLAILGPFLLATFASLQPATVTRLELLLDYSLVLVLGASALRVWRRIDL